MAAQAVLELILKLKDEASAGLEGLKGLASSLGPGLAAAGGVAAGAVLAIGASALDTAQQVDQARALIQDQLGVTAEEADALGDVATETFAQGFGESIADAAEGLIQVRQQMQGLDPSQLQGATDAAFQLQQAFGVDIADSTNAANTLMSQFGLSSQQAFDFLAQGFQKGLDNSGDFLDTIGEYSTQFSNGGADASQFFSLMESGLQGGVLGTDKAADAFKEFRLRIGDGSDATAAGLAQLGINAEELTAGLASGAITTADAFALVTGKLAETEDPTVRLQAGAALLGSQFEDLGDSAVAGLSLATTSLEDMAGASDKAGAQGETFSSRFEAAQRRLGVALAPVGEELLKVAEQYMPMVEAALVSLAPWIEENLPRAIEGLMAWWTDLNEGIGVVQQALDQVRQAVQPVIDAFAGFGQGLSDLWGSLPDWLTPGSPTPLEMGILGIRNALGVAQGPLGDFMGTLGDAGDAGDMINGVSSSLMGLAQSLPDLSNISLDSAAGDAATAALGLSTTDYAALKRLAEGQVGVNPYSGQFSDVGYQADMAQLTGIQERFGMRDAAAVGSGDVHVTVNVQGDVISEGQLVEKIRGALIELGRNNISAGIP